MTKKKYEYKCDEKQENKRLCLFPDEPSPRNCFRCTHLNAKEVPAEPVGGKPGDCITISGKWKEPELVICPKKTDDCQNYDCFHKEPHKTQDNCDSDVCGIIHKDAGICIPYRPEEPKKPVLSFAESTFLLSCYQEELKKIIDGIELIKHGLKIRQQQKE